jgi:probable phosphoglycerate mutase
MNHLSGVDRLANRFSIMRHGQSKANVRGIIVSRIENDRRGDYGLSELGRQQALAAARGCGLSGNTVIYSSDFSRARQTAEIVCAHLGAPEVVLAEALRERCFGDWEGAATGNYARVWAADETNPCHAGGNVEPAAAVLDRVTAFMVDLERHYSGREVLLVSHGDTLQILWAGLLRMNPSQHRSLPELRTAEIRQLRLPAREPAPTPLPESGGQQPVLLRRALRTVAALADTVVGLGTSDGAGCNIPEPCRDGDGRGVAQLGGIWRG